MLHRRCSTRFYIHLSNPIEHNHSPQGLIRKPLLIRLLVCIIIIFRKTKNFEHPLWISEVHSEASRTSTMELFSKVVHGFQPLPIFAKSFILDIQLSSEYTSEHHKRRISFQSSYLLQCFPEIFCSTEFPDSD